MLVLTRKVGTDVYMKLKDGTMITVTVLASSIGTVRLGIAAPADVQITRDDAFVKEPKRKAK